MLTIHASTIGYKFIPHPLLNSYQAQIKKAINSNTKIPDHMQASLFEEDESYYEQGIGIGLKNQNRVNRVVQLLTSSRISATMGEYLFFDDNYRPIIDKDFVLKTHEHFVNILIDVYNKLKDIYDTISEHIMEDGDCDFSKFPSVCDDIKI